jgi:hypothetical protein
MSGSKMMTLFSYLPQDPNIHISKDVVKGKCKILRMQTKIKSNSLDMGKSLYYNIKNKITGELVFAG